MLECPIALNTNEQQEEIEPGCLPGQSRSLATKMGKLLRGSFVFLFVLFVAVLILETFLHLAGVGQSEFLQPDMNLGVRHIAGKRVVWRLEGYSDDRISSSGLRDVEHAVQKPEGVTRIALLGDSTTEGLQVPLQDTYARVLENELNKDGKHKFEVINFACSSYATGQELLQFIGYVEQYHPSLTIVLYNKGDAQENIRDMQKKDLEPRPYFYLDQLNNLQEDHTAIAAQMSQKQCDDPIMDFLRKNSCVYGIFNQLNLSMSLHSPLYHKLSGYWKKLNQSMAGKCGCLTDYAVYPQPNAFIVTDAILSALAGECKKHSSKLLVVMYPNLLSEMELGMQANRIKELSAKEGFGFLDLTEAFKRTGNPNSYFLEYHFGTSGHKLVADELVKYIETNYLKKTQ